MESIVTEHEKTRPVILVDKIRIWDHDIWQQEYFDQILLVFVLRKGFVKGFDKVGIR